MAADEQDERSRTADLAEFQAPADEELQWRLLAIRSVLEREGGALAGCGDERMLDVLVEIDELKLSIANALGRLSPDRTPDS